MGPPWGTKCTTPSATDPMNQVDVNVPPVCPQATSPSAQVLAAATADATVRTQCERGSPTAVDIPYSYVVGYADEYEWFGARSGPHQGHGPRGATLNWYGPLDCNAALVGSTTDCPTARGAPGACEFTPQSVLDGASCGTAEDAWGCPATSILCTKLQYDAAFKTPCCMAAPSVGGVQSFSTPMLPQGVSAEADLVLCAPGWCPLDPLNECADVMLEQCGGSVSAAGGWVSALLETDVSSPYAACGAWYSQAIAGNAPASRWPYIDTLVENYCSNHPEDTTSCGCFLYSAGGSGVGNGFLWTSATQDGVTTPRPVRPVDAATSNTLNLSDYACIAPQCRGATLLTSDVWSQQHLGRCPDVCLQVVSDGDVTFDGDKVVGGGLYVDMATMACGGPLGSATTNTPALEDVTNHVRFMWPRYAGCATCCPAAGCSTPVPLVYGLTSVSADMAYAVTFDPPLPPGVTVVNPGALAGSLSWDGTPTVEIELAVAATATPPGQYRSTVTIADTRQEFATCRKSTVFDLVVYNTEADPPPQGPPAPNGGSGPPVVTTYVLPHWALVALGVVAALSHRGGAGAARRSG